MSFLSKWKKPFAHLFGAVRHDGDRLSLTGSQRWAFSWMPQSGIAVGIGCPSTAFCSAIALKAVRSFAVDSDDVYLRRITNGASGVFAITALPAKLPFPSGSVDTVFLLNVLEHAEKEAPIVNEVQRILRPGGKLILSVRLKGMLRFFKPRGAGKSYRRYSNDDLTRLLFLKFRTLRKHYGGLFLYPSTLAINNSLQEHFDLEGNRFLSKLGDLDNDISWGTWSFNAVILAEKI